MVRTRVRRRSSRVHLTISRKRLETQALRCNGELVSVVSTEKTTVSYGSNSTAMSAARISTTSSIAGMWPACVCMAYRSTMVHVRTYVPMVRTFVRTYNVMSQLSDWKRAHMCTENHVCFGRIHGSQLREGANAGRHIPALSLPPSHHCLDGEV